MATPHTRSAVCATHHNSVFLLARELGLIDVLITIGFGVFRETGAFVFAQFT